MHRELTIQFIRGGFYGTWEQHEDDIRYLIQVWDGETLVHTCFVEGGQGTEEILLFEPLELTEGKEYTFRLEVITETAVGSGRIPEFSQRLSRLRENIMGSKTAEGCYVLNTETIEDDTVIGLMKEYLYIDTLSIANPEEPILLPEERALAVSGKDTEITFFIDDSLNLQMVARFNKDDFALFRETDYEPVQVSSPAFYFTTAEQTLAEGFEASCGLSFLGEVKLPEAIRTSKEPAAFGGPFKREDASIVYTGTSYNIHETLTLYTFDGKAHPLTEGQLLVEVTGEEAAVKLEGNLEIKEGVVYPVSALLTPEMLEDEGENGDKLGPIYILLKEPGRFMSAMTEAEAFMDVDATAFFFTDAIRALTDLDILEAGYIWGGPEDENDQTFVRVGSTGQPIVLIEDVLQLTDWTISGRHGTYLAGETVMDWYGAKLTGDFLIGEAKKANLSASIGSLSDWSVTLTCGEGSWLEGLCNIAGLDPSEIQQRVPFLWKGAEAFTLDRVYGSFLPKQKQMTEASFSLHQTEPWNLMPPALTISDIAVACRLKRKEPGDDWEYRLSIEGAVKIGSGEKEAELFVSVPVEKNMTAVTIKTGERGIKLPSIEDMLALVGIGDGSRWIPEDFFNLDDIRISKMEIEAAIKPAAAIESFRFGITTEKSYAFTIASLPFAVEKLEVLLDMAKGESPAFTGRGEFTLFGLQAEAEIYAKLAQERREKPKAVTVHAVLSAAQAETISFADMADSFAGDESAKYGNLPMPGSFQSPKFQDAQVYMDTGNDLYAMSGKVARLGQGVFAAAKVPREPLSGGKAATEGQASAGVQSVLPEGQPLQWEEPPVQPEQGYILAAAIDENFCFGGIVPELSLLDSYFGIMEAAILISSFASCGPDRLLNILPSSMVPEGLPDTSDMTEAGLALLGTVSLKASLFDNLIKLGSDEKAMELSVYARLPKETGATEIKGTVNGFSLLGVFDFKDITFCYAVKKEKEFSLSGKLSVTVGEQTLDFAGAMEVGEAQALFHVETGSSIANPLGMPGITLEALALSIMADFGKTTAYSTALTGEVTLGPVNLSGKLLLDGADVRVCSIKLEKPLHIDDLFTAIFAEGLWPTGIIDMSVQEGMLYYAGQDSNFGETLYKKGFHMDTGLSLWGLNFGVTADFTEEAFAVTGTMEEAINTGIMRITGAGSAAGPGIRFEGKEDSRTLGITGGIELFGQRLLDIDTLGYDFKKGCFAGKVSYNGSVAMFHGTISFTWDEKKGIEIKEFPMAFVDQLLDYAKLIEEASKSDKSGCGVLTGIFFDKVVQTDFSITPSFGGFADDRIIIELEPNYQVSVAGQKILSSSMEKIKVEVRKPREIGFEALGEMIVSAITDNAVGIAKQILNDSAGFTKMMTAIGTIKGSQEVLSRLICRGGGEMTKGLKDLGTAKEYAQAAKDAASGGGGGGSGSGGLGGAAGAAAGAGGASSSASGYFSGAASFFGCLAGGFILIGGGSTKEAEDMEEEAEKKKKEAEGAEKEARDAVRSMLNIENLQGEELDGSLLVSWKKIEAEGLDLKYHIKIVKDGKPFGEQVTTETSLRIALTPDTAENITVSVYAVLTYPEEKGVYTYIGDTASISCSTGQPLKILSETLPDAEAGTPYSYQIEVTGGKSPVKIEVEGLPAGLSADGGNISGVPRFSGGEVFVEVTATDSRGKTNKKSYWLKVK